MFPTYISKLTCFQVMFHEMEKFRLEFLVCDIIGRPMSVEDWMGWCLSFSLISFRKSAWAISGKYTFWFFMKISGSFWMIRTRDFTRIKAYVTHIFFTFSNCQKFKNFELFRVKKNYKNVCQWHRRWPNRYPVYLGLRFRRFSRRFV